MLQELGRLRQTGENRFVHQVWSAGADADFERLLYAFKYVNCHKENPNMNMFSVVGLGVLASTITGYPLFISEMTILTAIRTACTSALVAKYLMPSGSTTMAIVGNGYA